MFERVGHAEKMLFTRELSVLLKSGVSLRESMASLERQSKFFSMKRILRQVILDIENGQTLAHAFGRYPRVFNALYINLLYIGEQSGNLVINLEYLSDQLNRSYVLQKKVQGILLYPCIVLLSAGLLGSFISVFILPKLIRLFDSFEVALPLSTRVLLWFSVFMRDFGKEMLAGAFLALVSFRFLILLSWIRLLWHRTLLSIPLLGSFLKNVSLAMMFRDLGVMLQSGLPISKAVEIEAGITKNLAYARMLREWHEMLLQGKSIAGGIQGKYKLLMPETVVKMIAAGEKSGKLDETFLYLSDFLDAEVDRTAKNFTVLLEPTLLFIIGGTVAFLALAILSPIYSLTGSIHR